MEVKFSLDLESGNAAFGPTETAAAQEVARILRAVASQVEAAAGTAILVRPIRDANGNRVGSFDFEAERDDSDSDGCPECGAAAEYVESEWGGSLWCARCGARWESDE